MNTKIISLKSGELLIGQVENEIDLSDTAEIIFYHPMYIVQTVSDMSAVGFKLEDALLFSKDESIVLRPTDVLMTNAPTDTMDDYYTLAIEFNKKAVKPVVNKQIEESLIYMNEALEMVASGKPKKSRFSRTGLN